MQDLVGQYIEPESMEETWDLVGLQQALMNDYIIDIDLESIIERDESINGDNLWNVIHQEFQKNYNIKENTIGQRPMREIEKAIMIQQLDMQWREHLASMDHLRQGIHLRGYAQKNPKQEYKRESFEMFSFMMDQLKTNTIGILAKARFRGEDDAESVNQHTPKTDNVRLSHNHGSAVKPSDSGQKKSDTKTFVRGQDKIGRNEPCPCGSGKKYKKCHGMITQ